jgi:hypothetical protein
LVGELLLRKGTVNVYAPVVEKLELEPALLKKYVMVLLALVPVITTLPEFEVTVAPHSASSKPSLITCAKFLLIEIQDNTRTKRSNFFFIQQFYLVKQKSV